MGPQDFVVVLPWKAGNYLLIVISIGNVFVLLGRRMYPRWENREQTDGIDVPHRGQTDGIGVPPPVCQSTSSCDCGIHVLFFYL